MRWENPNLWVITGGPGSGKTTVLHELQNRGFRVVPEVARQIIREQVEAGGDALPWGNRGRYMDLMFARSVESYLQHTPSTEPTFSDRGVPDSICYSRLIGLEEQDALVRACEQYLYGRRAFFAPVWREIYETDAERKQDFVEAARTADLMRAVYEQCGYEIVELPKTPAGERADFILSNLQ